MENLNAEEVKRALNCCDGTLAGCEECPNYNNRYRCTIEAEALTLITSQEQKIFELENRLKECENGYDGTLFLDRCKLHDAEEKVRELTEENERLSTKGEWIKKHRHRGGFRTVTITDSFGEKHTGMVDDRYETDDLYCSVCGKIAHDAFLNYCANCGAKMKGE